MKPALRLSTDPEPTEAEIYQAKIDQSAREWRGEMNQPWQSIKLSPERKPLLHPDDVVSYKVIDVYVPMSRWRRVLRWWRGVE